jgi:hypothetical protein
MKPFAGKEGIGFFSRTHYRINELRLNINAFSFRNHKNYPIAGRFEEGNQQSAGKLKEEVIGFQRRRMCGPQV